MTRIYYACFAHNLPRGGIKVIYRHVDILNRANVEAYVFHPRERFRASWFENDTRIVGPRELARRFDPRSDVLVLPEDLIAQPAGAVLLHAPGRKVIFNQNVYYGFAAIGTQPPRRSPYRRADVRAVFAVSDHNAALLRFAFPGVTVLRLHLGVDQARFQLRPIASKHRQIAAAMKAPLSMLAVRHVVAARAQAALSPLRGFRWRFLENLSEQQVATVLGDSLITLFFGTDEGFGLLPLEAMLSGSVVAAFTGGPADEFLPERYRFALGDIVGVVRFVERVATSVTEQPRLLERWTREGHARAVAYSLRAEQDSVLDAWSKVLASPRRRVGSTDA